MDLSLDGLVTLVVFGSLGVVVFVTLVSRFLHKKAEAALVRQRRTCRLCGHIYLSSNASKVEHCVSCDALNLQRKNGKLG